VSRDLGVDVVITGVVKRDGGWILQVSARHGPTGKSVKKLRYPLRGPRLDPATLKRMAADLPDAIDAASQGPPQGEEAEKEAPEAPVAEEKPPPPEQPPEEENPLQKKEPKEKPEKPAGPRIERPVWTPYFDASAGFILTSRQFSFDTAGLPAFHSTIAPGLRIDATGYPLAILANRPGAAMNALTGLGVGITYDAIFWADSKPCPPHAPGTPCPDTTEAYGTSETRLEAGLRWHWNFLMKPIRPDLLVTTQYGLHSFTIAKRPDGSDVGPPDVTYQYFSIGVGVRVPFTSYLAAGLLFNIHAVLDSGSVQTTAELGPGSAFGFRVHLWLEGRIWRGLTARLAAFYEQFGLGFDAPPATKMASSATDQYYGGILSIGYVY
jgi:hypothetical protein